MGGIKQTQERLTLRLQSRPVGAGVAPTRTAFPHDFLRIIINWGSESRENYLLWMKISTAWVVK